MLPNQIRRRQIPRHKVQKTLACSALVYSRTINNRYIPSDANQHGHSVPASSQTTGHPYQAGRKLQIYFKPETSHHSAEGSLSVQQSEAQTQLSPPSRNSFTLLDISILRAFTPFTSAVVLLAEAIDPPKHLLLPRQFILKLNDRRFGYRDDLRPQLLWSPEIEAPLRRGIETLVGPDRSHPIPTVYRRPKWDRPGDDSDGPIEEWEGWELEVYVWMMKYGAYLGETLAYRHLRSLQGSIIPRLHGTVRLPISEGNPFLHPIVDLVHGLASPSMADLSIGVDITSQRAEEISRRILDGVATIRDAYCHHNDLRLANVVFRNWPHDPQPVVIDFGASCIELRGSPEEKTFGTVNEVREMRSLLSDSDWHIRSPLQQHVYERYAQSRGYAIINSQIEEIADHIRATQFERILGSEQADKGLQWRVRPGIRTQDDYEHEWSLAFPTDPD
ncbi:hypothetical protein C8R45DRAFT_899460 [Mycena sanguinolenta]|nr:hypothetical protein C8R45DRAFT_899460 [Mycena sanguinolenta]